MVIDSAQRKVLLDGREIGLLYQEFQLLEFLAMHPYRAFTRDQLLAGAWPGRRQDSSRTVDVHVHRLRRKLGPGYARYLITVRRVGYMFLPPQLAVGPSSAVPAPGSRPAQVTRRRAYGIRRAP